VLAAPQQLQHLASMYKACRLAEDLAIAFGDRVAADHQTAIDVQGDIAGLLKGQSGYKFRRRLTAADAALGGLMRRDDRE
jgi:hypothetical protein